MKLNKLKSIIKETIQNLKEDDIMLDMIVLCGCSGDNPAQCGGEVDNSDPFAGPTGDCSCCGAGMAVSATLVSRSMGRDIPVMGTNRPMKKKMMPRKKM